MMKAINIIGEMYTTDGCKVIHCHPCTIYCPKTGEYWESSFECADAIDVIDTNFINKEYLGKLGFSGDSEWMVNISNGYTAKYDMRGRSLHIHKKNGNTLVFNRINQIFELEGILRCL